MFPEGVALNGKFNFKNQFLESLEINTGHFIIATNSTDFTADSYFQGLQLVTSFWEDRLVFFPAMYYFNNIPDVPDGNETYSLNYAIANIGFQIVMMKEKNIKLEVDFYQNLNNLSVNNFVSQVFRNQKKGIVTATGMGKLNKKGDWKTLVTYTYLERFAAVDFLAQNDWARWDYSSQGSPDGRLTNFKGLELMVGYALRENMNLTMRFFTVNQLVSTGLKTETGNRIRLDFNIGF
ncbi:putative porin [Joostella atrarenae]|uniref:Porin n=1 Tax=Joostella atrarenae TaxID=679257 RepID=A0ABS9J2S5_9FLAO|nr:putative porin [Joostella atrarenae]MCF8714709.1 putative porin [Joostella atrarenae]